MSKVYKFKKNDEIEGLMEIQNTELRSSRIWKAVNIISDYLSDEDITYDEFVCICDIIDEYTRRQALIEANLMERENPDDPEFEDFEIDLDEEDGGWFTIPYIG